MTGQRDKKPADLAQLSREELGRVLNRLIAQIDQQLGDAVDAIIHHPAFQRLEAAWRSVDYLVQQVELLDDDDRQAIQIRLIDVSWKELTRDLESAIEFDQSALFEKVYSNEFGTAGGIPFTVLLGDYEIRHRITAEHPIDDLGGLMRVSQVAAAAFAPFIAGADPALLGMEQFEPLERAPNLSRTFDQLEYLKWRAIRHTEDARFVGLTLPRVLARLPYGDDDVLDHGFVYREDVIGPDRSKYLWANAAFALGGVLIHSFAESRWFADIRGTQRGSDGGGLVSGLPAHSFSTDKSGVAVKCSVDVMIADDQEKQLADLGLIPLCHCRDTEYSVFFGNPSIQKPRSYDDPVASGSARISAMLQTMLCSSRFAHYLKVIARDKVGAFNDAAAFESYLHSWLQRYVAPDLGISAEQKAKFPLRSARVKVRDTPGKPGFYLADVQLWPHFQLDELKASVKLVTELVGGGGQD